MTLERLFDRCPEIPVDSTIPLPLYIRNIREMVRQLKESKQSNDMDTAAVQQIQILQLICKTLPSHPDYHLPENKPAIKEFRSIAHTGFSNIERLAEALNQPDIIPDVTIPSAPETQRGRMRPLELSVSLLELFERIAAENTLKLLNTVCLLAGRVDGAHSAESGPAQESLSSVTALVIPSQTCHSDRSDMRYGIDITQLLQVKGLVRMGFVEICPNQRQNFLRPSSAKMLSLLQRERSEAVGIVIAPQDAARICAYSLTADGLRYVLSCAGGKRMPEDFVPDGEEGAGKQTWAVAKHVDIRSDGKPLFKLYDLRPLSVARDEQERTVKTKSVN